MTEIEMQRKIDEACHGRHSLCTSNGGCPLYRDGKCLSLILDVQTAYEMMFREEKTDTVNHPSHYQGKYECIDEMVALFGVEAVKHFCMCNVHKYRYRAANKNGQEDLDKADWYMGKLMELEGMSDAAGARIP